MTRAAGWWHNFVCPTHDTEFSGWSAGAADCPLGCRVTGERYEGAWVVLQRQGQARRARMLARTDAPTGRDLLETIATEYNALPTGENQSAEGWMLRGRMFAQALTEAIWAAQLADAAHEIGVKEGTATHEMLTALHALVADAWYVQARVKNDEQSNYTAWFCAAGSLLSLALGLDRATWLSRLDAHLALAIGRDGWEWEGASYYHMFVLRAYLLALKGVPASDIPQPTVAGMRAMADVLSSFATPAGRIPVLHDGPYDRAPAHLEILEVCTLAKGLWDRTGLEQVEAWVRDRLGPDSDGLEDRLAPWFTGTPLPGGPADRRSVLFDAVGFAVLRDADDTWQAVVDAGPHGGAHGHLDKGALYLYGTDTDWQPAPGVPPYGSSLRHGHYRRTVAHPTLRVDDADQVEASGAVMTWEVAPDGGRLVVDCSDATPGVTFTRTCVMASGVLIDLVEAEAEWDRRFTLALRPAGDLDVREDEGRWLTTWGGEVPLLGHHVASGEARMVAVPGRGPSDQPATPLTTVDWSVDGRTAAFLSIYHPDATPRVRSVALDPPAVTLTDGTTIEVRK